jgi:hypothetical protein
MAAGMRKSTGTSTREIDAADIDANDIINRTFRNEL